MYKKSLFHYLYENKKEQALLSATGVDHEEFGKLLEIFQPVEMLSGKPGASRVVFKNCDDALQQDHSNTASFNAGSQRAVATTSSSTPSPFGRSCNKGAREVVEYFIG